MKISSALRHTLILATVGVITIFLMIYVQQNIFKTHYRNLPYLSLNDFVKNNSTQAHLWFEELLAGDKTLDFERDVLSPLQAALTVLQGAYDGKQTELGIFTKPTDEETRAILKETIIENEKLIAAAKEKWQAQTQIDQPSVDSTGSSVDSTGTSLTASKGELDLSFDQSYKNLQRNSDRLGDHIKKKITEDNDYVNSISWASIGLVTIAFGFLCLFVYKVQRDSDQQVTGDRIKLEEESKRVGTLSKFIEAVSGGNYDIELQQASGDDNLTNMLITMRDKLRQTAEDDRRRNWSTNGLAQVGEILRASTKNISELYDNIIKFLVKYTKSNQGGLFILNDDNAADRYLELVACYAFERKKYLTKKVSPGDGLVGQCFLEAEHIYLTEVPEEYLSITSGLGGTNPNALLVVPLKVNDKVYGVIELASLNKFRDFEIELVEKLAETIASTISGVKINETTRILLEQTQQQAEEMKSQEEEIRQNMEELEATQEEMRRKQTVLEKELQQSQQQAEVLRVQEKRLMESQDTLQAIVDNIPRAIFWKDKDLRFMGCNKIFAAVAGAESHRDLIGKSDFDMAWSAQADAYRKDDMEVMRKRQPKLDIEEVNINSEGEESWVLTSKVPIINEGGDVVAILGMFEDITARKKKEADIARKLQEREAAIRELYELKQMLQTGKA